MNDEWRNSPVLVVGESGQLFTVHCSPGLGMKQVHVAKHAPEAYLVKGFLESNGIEAVVRGEFLTGGWGELPVDLCSVWITDDAQYERADALLVAYLRGDFAREFRDQNWRCPGCGEQLEGQFTACWKCGARRPA